MTWEEWRAAERKRGKPADYDHGGWTALAGLPDDEAQTAWWRCGWREQRVVWERRQAAAVAIGSP